MADEELSGLSPREVIALVRQLEGRLRAVESELAAAQARIAELEAELARRGAISSSRSPAQRPPAEHV
jgi:hypothetical protein